MILFLCCSGKIWSNVEEAAGESGRRGELPQTKQTQRVRGSLQRRGNSQQQPVSKVTLPLANGAQSNYLY